MEVDEDDKLVEELWWLLFIIVSSNVVCIHLSSEDVREKLSSRLISDLPVIVQAESLVEDISDNVGCLQS